MHALFSVNHLYVDTNAHNFDAASERCSPDILINMNWSWIFLYTISHLASVTDALSLPLIVWVTPCTSQPGNKPWLNAGKFKTYRWCMVSNWLKVLWSKESGLWFLNHKYSKPLVCLIAETCKDSQGVRRECVDIQQAGNENGLEAEIKQPHPVDKCRIEWNVCVTDSKTISVLESIKPILSISNQSCMTW